MPRAPPMMRATWPANFIANPPVVIGLGAASME